jgi:RimJ/RimL family protein N-acetyltransferase
MRYDIAESEHEYHPYLVYYSLIILSGAIDMNMFLDSDNIYLRTLERDDLDLFWQWFADREVIRYSMGMLIFPFSKAETQEWLEQTVHDKQVLSLGIVEKASDQLIGYAGITSISNINRSGEYYIFIGNKGSWGKGYGTEVTRLIVNYGFRSLNLHRIMLTVFASNTAGIRGGPYATGKLSRGDIPRCHCDVDLAARMGTNAGSSISLSTDIWMN